MVLRIVVPNDHSSLSPTKFAQGSPSTPRLYLGGTSFQCPSLTLPQVLHDFLSNRHFAGPSHQRGHYVIPNVIFQAAMLSEWTERGHGLGAIQPTCSDAGF